MLFYEKKIKWKFFVEMVASQLVKLTLKVLGVEQQAKNIFRLTKVDKRASFRLKNANQRIGFSTQSTKKHLSRYNDSVYDSNTE